MCIVGKQIQIKVIPGASKTELIKLETGYKARIQCAPVDGKANSALIALLSKEFGIPKSDIEIIRGKTSRSKTVLLKTAQGRYYSNFRSEDFEVG